MESGPNPADQNFYARRPISNVNSLHQHQHQHRLPHPNNIHSHSSASPELPPLRLQQRTYEPPPLPDFDARSPQPQLPPKLPYLTTANLHAAATNGYVDGLTTGGGDPAEFYRDYRGVQQSPNGYTETTGTTNGMATTDSRPAPSSLRSNGNGNTPKHPHIPTRGIKNSYRSVSSPLDERSPLSSAKSSPQLNGISVKDMLKKFDQNLEGSTARKPSPRIGAKDGASTPGYMRDRTAYVGRTTGNSQNTSGTSRAGMSTREPAGRKSPEKMRATQRTRFATEDQHSNNTLSGVPRSTRPRTSVSTTSQASKSMTNLSPTTQPAAPKSNPSQTPARRPLFGEVLPIGPGSEDIGYGIPNAATRRTSDSNLHPSWQRQRSRSEVDVSPSSPTAWYLGVTPALDDVDPNKPPRSVHGHNRNHSDFQDSKVNTMNGVHPSFESPVVPSLPKPPTSSTPQSRLPISSKRLSNSSESSSPTSTRASSPFTAKQYSNVKLRKSEQRPWSPASRDSNRSNTPIQTRGKARKPEPPPTGTVLAHISSPPLQASPPLRGSRTRQPVSSASTNSSRQKAADRAGSPQHVRTGMKVTRNKGPPGFDDPPARTISDNTPVDWEAKKTKIRRAYTKSIHESEQKQIRAENLRRLSERTARDSLEAAGKESNATQLRPETPPPVPVIDPQVELRTPPQALQSSPPPLETSPRPLQVNTTFFKDEQSPLEKAKMTFEDSPTLGMPGTFIVDDEEPPSAISNATGITEIENEPQTEAARLRRLPSTKRKEPSRLSSNVISWTDDMLSPEQALYGMAHEESIDVKLASTPVEKAEPTPTKDVRDPSPPGAFQEDADDQPVFATTLTSASPEDTSPAPSRPPTLFESGDEQGSSSVELPKEATPPIEPLPEFQSPPEITLPDEGRNSPIPDSVDGPRLQLPDFRTALAPSSVASNDGATDYLNTPVTDMDYDSSDGAGVPIHSEQGIYEESYDTARDPIPSSRGHRSSHQSSWTDYSLDSQGYSEHDNHSKPPPVTISDTEQSSRPHSQSPTPPVPPKPEGYSPQPSPRFSATSPQIASPHRHQLPPLSTGEGFGFGFAEQTLPLWPDHSPPPIPDQSLEASPVVPTRTPPLPGQHSRRPPSSIDQSSHNDASQHPESRRPSDDLYSPRPSVSTPRSSTQISFEDAVKDAMSAPKPPPVPETEEEREAARLLDKRLTKRKRQLMELIDTESVYLKDMNVVEEIYKGTAEACPKLEIGDVRIIFRNTDKIVAFTTMLLDELRSAVAPVYSPRTPKYRGSKAGTPTTTASDRFSVAPTLNDEQTMEERDMRTTVGACFNRHLKEVTIIYTEWIKSSEAATARLTTLMTDHAVQVWLNECNTVAKDLTTAWDIDSLLVKPFQRLCRYQLLLVELQSTTPPDHPDMPALISAASSYKALMHDINDMTRRVKLVGDIVKGRKRKESNVRQGIGKVFGQKSAKKEKDEKLDQATARGEDDPEFTALKEKHNDNFLRMQVVLRDVQFHLRQCIAYVDTDLKYKSAMELVMRLSASPWPELESKWARFNMSMRDMGTVALDQHTAALQTQVIEPFEKLIQLYNPANLAMKKREKRRSDYEKILAAKKSGSKLSEKEQTKLDQYEALTETLKSELPMLFEKTETIANLLLGHLVVINTRWYDVWQKKVSVVLEEKDIPKTLDEVVVTFNREFEFVEREAQKLGIVNGSIHTNLEKVSSAGKPSTDTSDSRSRRDMDMKKGRPSDLSSRSRGLSVTSDKSPSLPTPDFVKRNSGSQFTFSPITANTPNVPQFAYQNQPYQNQPYQNQPYSTGHSRAGSGSPAMPDPRAVGRPSTSRSYTSDSGAMRMSNDYNTQPRRESGSTYTSSHHIDGPPISNSTRPYSGIFHSAMPLPDGPEDSALSSRASSRDRNVSGGYNVLYLAASLFEFNIEATKSEAGYPYLTYQAGEIFDVIGEKGELWLAKNQDDPREVVGWIWSKHFARLASD